MKLNTSPVSHMSHWCNALQRTATHCNTLQHTVRWCHTCHMRHITVWDERWETTSHVCVAVCCSVLQCVAVCCSVLQCVAVCCSVFRWEMRDDKSCVTLVYLKLNLYVPFYWTHPWPRRVAVCCSVLQCVAVFLDERCETTSHVCDTHHMWMSHVTYISHVSCHTYDLLCLISHVSCLMSLARLSFLARASWSQTETEANRERKET